MLSRHHAGLCFLLVLQWHTRSQLAVANCNQQVRKAASWQLNWLQLRDTFWEMEGTSSGFETQSNITWWLWSTAFLQDCEHPLWAQRTMRVWRMSWSSNTARALMSERCPLASVIHLWSQARSSFPLHCGYYWDLECWSQLVASVHSASYSSEYFQVIWFG